MLQPGLLVLITSQSLLFGKNLSQDTKPVLDLADIPYRPGHDEPSKGLFEITEVCLYTWNDETDQVCMTRLFFLKGFPPLSEI